MKGNAASSGSLGNIPCPALSGLMEAFDSMISLGGRCQVAAQLRRRYPMLKAQPFDWLITPDASLLKMLERGVPGFSADLPLEIAPSHTAHMNKSHVREGEYGTLLSHDFLNDGTDFQAQWPLIRPRYDHVFRRFHETLEASQRILFVRMSFGRSGSFGSDIDDRASPDMGSRIADLIRQRWPKLAFHLLCISHKEEDTGCTPNVTVLHMPEQKAWKWNGDDAIWDRLLAPYGLTQ